MVELIGSAALAASLVAASSAVARVWGHAVGGVISAFPLIVGPVLLLAAVRQDTASAADTAAAALLGLVALSGFAATYGRAARRWRRPVSSGLGWTAAAVIGVLAGHVAAGPLGALAAAALSIALALAAQPRVRETESSEGLPVWELPARMALTAVLIVGLTLAGERFGPTVAGILASLPTLASVLAGFTHSRHGPDAVLALLRGMLRGLAGFACFCALIALLVEPAGVVVAFSLATAAAAGIQLALALRRTGRTPVAA